MRAAHTSCTSSPEKSSGSGSGSGRARRRLVPPAKADRFYLGCLLTWYLSCPFKSTHRVRVRPEGTAKCGSALSLLQVRTRLQAPARLGSWTHWQGDRQAAAATQRKSLHLRTRASCARPARLGRSLPSAPATQVTNWLKYRVAVEAHTPPLHARKLGATTNACTCSRLSARVCRHAASRTSRCKRKHIDCTSAPS